MTNIETARNLKLAAAAQQFEAACKASKQHSDLAQSALLQYGDHGNPVSGCVRDHFPHDVKEQLRTLARAVTAYNDTGMALRPKRVRTLTMIRLARSIAKRDGTGYYGFQPF